MLQPVFEVEHCDVNGPKTRLLVPIAGSARRPPALEIEEAEDSAPRRGMVGGGGIVVRADRADSAWVMPTEEEDEREEERRRVLSVGSESSERFVVLKSAVPALALPSSPPQKPAAPSSSSSSLSSPQSPSSSLMKGFQTRFSILSTKTLKWAGRGAKGDGAASSDNSIRLFSTSEDGGGSESNTSTSIAAQSQNLASFTGGGSIGSQSSSPKTHRRNGGMWNTMRKEVHVMGRIALEAMLREEIDNPDLNHVVKLAHSLIDGKHHSSAAAYSGALLMEWAVFRGFVLSPTETRLLASAHAEIWASRGLAAENYNLLRARVLYEQALKSVENLIDASLWIEYSRVLTYFGDFQKAAVVMQQVITSFEDDPLLPSYLFVLGGILKSCEQNEEASNFFFEAAMTGPPKHFSKLEMMFIISRNIEAESRASEGSNEDAYLMVYDHLVMEELLDGSAVSYEQWISSSKTWRDLGDKCSLHGAHSLACDLYGQGLMKDPQAFRKPKLWFGFAKACLRCGRTSDAQLAVKQALTMEPFNQQLLRAYEMCSQMTHDFEVMLEGDLDTILDTLPARKGVDPTLRMQAVARGMSERTSFRKGVGSRGDIKKKMRARAGVLLGGRHPLVLSAKATWLGSVGEIIATDLDGGVARLKLKHPFTPIKETGLPRKMSLTLSAEPDSLYDRHLIYLMFVDEDTGEYLRRTLTLSFREHDSAGHVIHETSAGHIEDEEDDEGAAARLEMHPSSLLESLRFKDSHDVRTNIVDVDVERGAFVHQGSSYVYHVRLQEHDTNVEILHVATDRRLVFRMQREHIDRTFSLKRHVVRLLDVVTKYPRVGEVMFGRASDDAAVGEEGLWPAKGHNREGIIFDGKLVLIRILPNEDGAAVVRLFEANGLPLIGHSIEDVDPEALQQDLPSRRKRRQREIDAKNIKDAAKGGEGAGETIEASVEKPVITRAPSMESGLKGKEASAVLAATIPKPEPKAEPEPAPLVADVKEQADMPEPVADTEADTSPGEVKDEGESAVEEIVAEPTSEETENQPPSSLAKVAEGEEDDEEALAALAEGGDTFGGPEGSLGGGSLEASLESLEGGDGMEGGDDQGDTADAADGDGAGDDDEKDDGDEATEADDDVSGKKKGGKSKKKSKKDRLKEERKAARQKILQKKMAAQATEEGRLPAQASAADEAKQLERENKKKLLKEKMAADKAAMEAAAKDKAEKKRAAEELKKKIQTASESAPKEARIKAKKAALQAMNFLEHQNARIEAGEYIRDRARRALWTCAREDAVLYFRERVADAKRAYIASLAERAAQEAADLAAAEEAARKTAERIAQAETRKPGARGKSIVDKKSKKSVLFRQRSSLVGRPGDALGSKSDEAEAELQGTGEGEDEEEGREAREPREVKEEGREVEGEETDERPALETAVDPLEAPVPEQPEEELVDEAPKRIRVKIPKAAPVTTRAPIKITINHPPALTRKQKAALRLQWDSSQLTADAYVSPEGLVAALQSMYRQTVTPWDAAPGLAAPSEGGPGGLAVEVEGQAGGQGGGVIAADAVQGSGGELTVPFPAVDAPPVVPPLPEGSRPADSDAPALSDAPATDPATDTPAPETPSPAVPSIAPHLLALLDPSLARARATQAADASARTLRVLSMSNLSERDLRDLRTPLPINADCSATSFVPDRLTDVSIAKDAKMDQFRRKQRAQRLLQASAPGSDTRPAFLITGIAGSAPSGAPSAPAMARPRVKASHSPSPFDPVKAFNPVGFLDAVSVSSLDAGLASVEAYDARGYADGASPYTSLWRNKLASCQDLFPGPPALRKALAHLQKACPLGISRLEAFCALADSAGSYSEALGRLESVEFQREVKTVCAMLPVEQMLLKQLGGALGPSGSLDGFESTAGSSLGHASSSHRVFKSVAESPMLRKLKGVYTNTPTQSESLLAFDLPPGALDPLGSGISVDTGPSTLRASGLESRRLLPHLDMQQSSPIVQARGTPIRVPGKMGLPAMQPSVAPLSASGMGVGMTPLADMPAEFPSDFSVASSLVTDYRYQRAIDGLGQGSFDGSLEAGPDSPSTSPLVLHRKQATTGHHVAPVVEYNVIGAKSLRLGSAIDILYQSAPPSMVVMCRRDALRAAGEEVLTRSPHKKLQMLANKRAAGWQRYQDKLEQHQ